MNGCGCWTQILLTQCLCGKSKLPLGIQTLVTPTKRERFTKYLTNLSREIKKYGGGRAPSSGRPRSLSEGPEPKDPATKRGDQSCLYKQRYEDRREKWTSPSTTPNGATRFIFVSSVPSFCLCRHFLLSHCINFNLLKPFSSKGILDEWPISSA